MADIKLPEEIVIWISARNWGDHHDEWHTVRRWDIYHQLAERARNGETRFNWAIAVVDYIVLRSWTKAAFQEGMTGNGFEFLAMHRAMIQLLKEAFPQHTLLFDGWSSPPTDPNEPNDPVADGSSFNNNMLSAVNNIENNQSAFTIDDDFGLYLETSLRPTAVNPFARSTDSSTGLHNYLHGRWTDNNSDINLGDPTVNIYNQRFWNLHGWIDSMWTLYRNTTGAVETQEYLDKIAHYKHMMNMTQPMHEITIMSDKSFQRNLVVRPVGLNTTFEDSLLD